MAKIKILRAFSRMEQPLDRLGVTAMPPVARAISYARLRWFAEIYAGERVSLRLDGLALTVPRAFTTHFVFRDYEPLTKRTFLQGIKPGMTVVDVGAHIGYFTLLAARLVGPEGRVHAVEPGPDSLDILSINVSSNKFQNVQIHPVAAGSYSRRREFRLTKSSDSCGFYPHPNSATIQTVDVDQRTVDEIVGGQVDAIKIDVEGAELEVLEGMAEILRRNAPLLLWAEWFPAGMLAAGRDPEQLPEALRLHGFTNMSVIDERARTILSVGEACSLLRSGNLPRDWYANIYAKRCSPFAAS